MSASSEDESSFDLDRGVDLFIQDTQLDNPNSLLVRTSSAPNENAEQVEPSDDELEAGYNAVGQCTQVDNGEYSDDDSYVGDGDMYGATQVDDDYLRRLAESYELREEVERNVQQLEVTTTEPEPQSRATLAAAKQDADDNTSRHMEDAYVPVDDVENSPVMQKESSQAAAEEPEDHVRAESADVEDPKKLESHGESEEVKEEEGEEDEEENYVDFCIADTQPPTRHSSVHNKLPSVGTASHTSATEAVEVATEPATAPPEDLEETHLTVYDYLSLSAPLSHEVAKPDDNVFSDLDGPSHPLPTAATNASISSNAFATAKTGTIYRTPRLGSKDAPLNVEESPTQLDGSLHLSGDSHSVGGSLASHLSASSHSVLLSGEDVQLVAEKEKSPEVVVAAAIQNPVQRADTGGEWLSTKNPKPPALPPMAPTLIRLTPQKVPAPTNVSTSSGSKAVRAGESETQLFDVDDSQALGDALDNKSLEELVRMQEKLSRAIHSKTQNVTTHTPRQTAAGTAEKALVNVETGGSVEAPLARQQTSYGLSQPSNMAVSSLMMLKTTAGEVVVSPASTEQRKYTTFVADSSLAAVTPAGSNASTNAAKSASSAGSAGSDTSATHTPSPDSSARKFLKRKFGKPQSHVQALAAVAEEANLQFEMSDEGDDSEVPSPRSSDNEDKGKSKLSNATVVKAGVGKNGAAALNTVEKAAASSNSTAGKSKVRRIIIEDTQEEPEDDRAEDKETQRVDEEDAEFTADYFVRSPAPAPAAALAVSSSKSSEREAIAKALPLDFPKSFLQKIPVKFSELWHALTDIGWFWKRGGGIVSYYYVRPNCLVKKGFVMGQDYFGDENEVSKFVTKVVSEARAALKKQGIDVAPPPPPKAVLAPEARPVVSSSSSNATVAPAKPSSTTTTTTTTSVNNNSKLSHIPAARQLVPQFSTVSVTSGLLPPDDPCMADIRRIPWKWLWKLLRERDWTWDFGPAHTNFYFAPGYDIRSKHAVLGEHKFDSEESVRRFVRKQNWPEFSQHEQEREHSSAESQLPDAYLKDPTWQLASHRQKREREARPSDEDNNGSSDGEEGGGEFATKSVTSKTHAKKAAKTVEIAAPRASAVSKTAAVKSGKSGASGQTQKRNFTPEYDEPEQATQAQRMSQVSPLKKKPISVSEGGLFFSERRFVVSGIPEKLKAQLIKDISKLGGKILSTVPVDGNESRDEVEVDEKSGRAARKGPIYVVSHPREFRKPNYLMALATGVTLVHYQWITDCKDSNRWLPTESYLLPSGCCALHAFNIFPNRPPAADVTPRGKGGLGPSLPEPLLEGIKVLNFAGSGWDNLLLTTGATTVESEEPLLQALQTLGHRATSSSKGGRQSRSPVDVILVDPYEYSLSVAASKANSALGSSRYSTPNSLLTVGPSSKGKATAGAGTPKSPASKLGESELLVIQHCAELNAGENDISSLGSLSAMKSLPLHQRQAQQAAAPIVVTTDWLVHCVAMGEVLDHSVLDLFTLPPEPETRPFTYKADMVTSTGERYSKYDIVYYRSVKQQNALANRNSGMRASPSKAAKTSEVLSLGKITGFVRRDEKSQLFARIRPLISTHDEDSSSGLGGNFHPKGKVGEKDLARVRHKELAGDPLNALAMVEVERLSGKAILLHKDDFLRVSKYSFSDDSVYYASAMWTEENPPVLGEGSGEGSQEEDSQGMMMRVQRSQDY